MGRNISVPRALVPPGYNSSSVQDPNIQKIVHISSQLHVFDLKYRKVLGIKNNVPENIHNLILSFPILTMYIHIGPHTHRGTSKNSQKILKYVYLVQNILKPLFVCVVYTYILLLNID